MDVVLAVTDNEEINLLCSLLAKQMEANKVIARADLPDYVPLFEIRFYRKLEQRRDHKPFFKRLDRKPFEKRFDRKPRVMFRFDSLITQTLSA